MNNEMPFILSAWLQLKADRITVGKGKGKKVRSCNKACQLLMSIPVSIWSIPLLQVFCVPLSSPASCTPPFKGVCPLFSLIPLWRKHTTWGSLPLLFKKYAAYLYKQG